MARALSAEQQNVLRLQFVEALKQAAELDPRASARADVLFAIGRRAEAHRDGRV